MSEQLQTNSSFFCTVDVELFVGLYHLVGYDGVEVLYLCEPRMGRTIFLLDEAEPVAGDFHHVVQFGIDAGHLLADAGDMLFRLVIVELEDAGHLDFHQPQDVVAGDLAHEILFEGGEPAVHMVDGCFHVLGVLKLLVLVDAFLDEDAFQTGKVKRIQQFAFPDEPFLTQ